MAATKKAIKLAVDAVVMGYARAEGVSLLLIRRKYEPYQGQWALPGGFVKLGESLDDAISRELREETGISVSYLEQLYSFGEPDRDPREHVVSIAYMALVRSSAFEKLQASTDAEEASWFSIDRLPALAFDHKDIIRLALDRIRSKLFYQPIGLELLDKRFPFSDLEKLYIALLGRDIDRRNFSKKIHSLGLLEETEELDRSNGKGRPGKIFSFNRKRYKELMSEGFKIDL